MGDFPGGIADKNLPDNTGDSKFDPWSGKIPYTAEQLSPWAATTESMCPRAHKSQLLSPCAAAAKPCGALEPVVCSKRSHCNEKPEHLS